MEPEDLSATSSAELTLQYVDGKLHAHIQENRNVISYLAKDTHELTLDEQTSRFRLVPAGASFPPGLDFPFLCE